jgi:hypothetical protein
MKQMSVRWRPLLVRAALSVHEICLMLFGWFEYKNSYFGRASFSGRTGRVGFTPAVGQVALGSIFILDRYLTLAANFRLARTTGCQPPETAAHPLSESPSQKHFHHAALLGICDSCIGILQWKCA